MTDLHAFLADPAFLHVLHMPGLELPQTRAQIAGIGLRPLRWVEWLVLEHTATAEALKAEFEHGRHSFAVVERTDFTGDDAQAEAMGADDLAALQRVVSALRLVKSGDLLDPAGSVRYERRGSLNRRYVGHFGRQLFEPEHARTYVLGKADVVAAEVIAADLAHPQVAADRTIRLAIRHFDASYDHTLEARDRLLHLFTSLEATFGEYKKQARPVTGASLGQSAAALCPSATRAATTNFLDDKAQARGLRNAVAHGDLDDRDPAQLDAAVERLRSVLRVGLRGLVRFAARRHGSTVTLDSISAGLGALPPKAAFQHVLGHAAKGSIAARDLLAALSA
ncbi:hypothetical protein ACQ859_30060 [Roseateles chitinivorans]|uniref:hypothetical protein n=1 Tax=Roseateles chitinivorans TaxID=2917965 RepID=UPI003D67DB29